MLAGERPLPWEGGLSPRTQRRLGILRRPVLQLLQREPSRRSTMEDFCDSCGHILTSRTMEA